ncbi:MAG TPA: tyrosinase family protein [Thermoleophilaceae bacterium]|nr:tyrosinase family protein [Thermoleophilaceae bacterium]
MLTALALGAITAPAQAEEVLVRKSVTALTTQERANYVQAVLALKSTPSPYDSRFSYYDQFVEWHVLINRCDGKDTVADDRQNAHGGPVFLPWHREFLDRFEEALNEVSDVPVALPYWDWTDRSSVDPGNPNGVFRDDFMGGDGDPEQDYAVTTGPFRKGEFRINVHHEGAHNSPSNVGDAITRRLGSTGRLPTKAEVDAALARPTYDVAPWSDTSDPDVSFRSRLEGSPQTHFRKEVGAPPSFTGCSPDGHTGALPNPFFFGNEAGPHGVVHGWVGGILNDGPVPLSGGTMTVNSASPNDPVFFLHHANVDRIWALWQKRTGIDTSYKPTTEYPKNNADEAMIPFEETPLDVEDTDALGYVYADPPAPSAASVATGPAPVTTRSESSYLCPLGAGSRGA